MKIYLGAISPAVWEAANKTAPTYDYGATWTPAKMTPHDWPYFLDNGVYASWVKDEAWGVVQWRETLQEAQRKMPRYPDFAVLPDAVGNPATSWQRTVKYADEVPDKWNTAFAIQDAMDIHGAVEKADELGCTTMFIGGTMGWKRRNAQEIVDAAHETGLKAHLARPGLPDGLMWAENIGADSVDTTTIARDRSYEHLQALEEQETLNV